MLKNAKSPIRDDSKLIEIKSKYYVEFRRYSLNRAEISKFEEFSKQIETIHNLDDVPFTICYTDPKDGSLLPINNDDNYALAVNSAKPLLRVIIQKKGESWEEINGYGSAQKKKNFLSQYLSTPLTHSTKFSRPHISISLPEDFRQVSAIIDVDIVPETCIRVQLLKHGSDKPLGFFIRDGTSVRVTEHGLEKVPGIFISRLLPGGLAESTGLLAVNDEVMEVNGIRVDGKTLDQVTDMMVANSSNLIITVKPGDNSNVKAPRRGSFGRSSQMSAGSHQSSAHSLQSDEDRFDHDEVRDLTGVGDIESHETSTASDGYSASNHISDSSVVTL